MYEQTKHSNDDNSTLSFSLELTHCHFHWNSEASRIARIHTKKHKTKQKMPHIASLFSSSKKEISVW